jgi:hypothetical protein
MGMSGSDAARKAGYAEKYVSTQAYHTRERIRERVNMALVEAGRHPEGLGARIRRSLRTRSPSQRLAFSRSLPSRLALQLLLSRLRRSTTHSRKSRAEPSQKLVRAGQHLHAWPTEAVPTGPNSYFVSHVSFLRYDSEV